MQLFILKKGPLQAAFTNYGARLVSLLVPDSKGRLTEVTLGLASFEEYVAASPAFFGSTVGRYANRIALGKFALDGNLHQLAQNLGHHHLHGGIHNFQEQVWDAEQPDDATVVFRYRSADGEEGYPGNMNITARYALGADNELEAFFEATTDAPTVINITNHAYFNLNGQGSGNVLQHRLQINADCITQTDKDSIPTGVLLPVQGTPFDFRQPKAIGRDMEEDHEQLRFGSGYDHNFVLHKKAGNELSLAAVAVGNESGIVMEVHTTEPGIQLYGANFLKGTVRLRNGATDEKHSGFCLETQHFPDSPNQPQFPTTRLNPGEVFTSQTVWRFGVQA